MPAHEKLHTGQNGAGKTGAQTGGITHKRPFSGMTNAAAHPMGSEKQLFTKDSIPQIFAKAMKNCQRRPDLSKFALWWGGAT